MKVPDKIYLTTNENGTHYYTEGIPFERKYVEYIRTDVFIEKVVIWFNNHFIAHDEYGIMSNSFDTEEEMFEDLKKAMSE